MTTITHKRGDTFSLACTVENAGVPVNITSWTITSQARDAADTVLQSFAVTKTDATNGAFTVAATSTQTEAWSLGTYSMDIEFVESGGEVNSTETFTLSVLRDITRA